LKQISNFSFPALLVISSSGFERGGGGCHFVTRAAAAASAAINIEKKPIPKQQITFIFFFPTFWHRLWGAASIGKDWMQALDCF
jgi:hypothetical protein